MLNSLTIESSFNIFYLNLKIIILFLYVRK